MKENLPKGNTRGNHMQALAIILRALTAMLIAGERISVRLCGGRLVISGGSWVADRLQSSVPDLISTLSAADCLRYAEEVAAYLIIDQYNPE